VRRLDVRACEVSVTDQSSTELKLNGLRLRSLRPEDAPSLARYANDVDVWRNLRDAFPHPYGVEHATRFIEDVASGDEGALVLGLEVDGAIVGVCGAYPQDDVYARSAEVGYWLGRQFHGRGLATQALRALTDHVFATLDVARLFAGVFAWNPASARVLEKCGYVREGVLRSSVMKDGQLIDSYLYAKVRGD
jgi:RimJ/RimL family protein N-acetyltransferase